MEELMAHIRNGKGTFFNKILYFLFWFCMIGLYLSKGAGIFEREIFHGKVL